MDDVAITPEMKVAIDAVRKPTEGRKDDGAKIGLFLLPPDALEEIGKVLDFGAKKYEARNWERGMAWSRVYGACLRHLFSYWKGEDKDPETGLSHLAHAGACIVFLISYHLRRTGIDDRHKIVRAGASDGKVQEGS